MCEPTTYCQVDYFATIQLLNQYQSGAGLQPCGQVFAAVKLCATEDRWSSFTGDSTLVVSERDQHVSLVLIYISSFTR